MYVIAGLGNPGEKYAQTRHNVGFMTVDYLAKLYNIKINKLKHKALVGEGNVQGEKVLLVKPQTFMNLSGESLGEIKSFYKLQSTDFIIIYDDMSLPLAKLRIRPHGSDGGHNGIKSVLYHFGTDIFPRIKIGIGAPEHSDYDAADFVTGKFSKEETACIAEAVEKAADAVVSIMKAGTDETMNKFN